LESLVRYNLIHYVKLCSKKRHAPEGSTPGPKLEPAILSVEVYCDSLA